MQIVKYDVGDTKRVSIKKTPKETDYLERNKIVKSLMQEIFDS